MRYAYLRLFAASAIAIACDLFVAMAQAPVANLPLTCPSAAAIGQQSCSNLTYQSPTSEQLIVLRSNGTWARAANLAGTDTVAVCALPVQPGTYSSCRDASGVRRIAYVPKSQVFTVRRPPPSGGTGGSPGSIAVVAASGGHYTDPLAAVANAEQGDAWCRKAGDDPARYPCVISIAPGVYELASTLIVPAHVSVIGYGPNMTVLTARPGVAVTVQLGFAGLDPVFDVALRDLAVENRFGAGATSVALDIVDNSSRGLQRSRDRVGRKRERRRALRGPDVAACRLLSDYSRPRRRAVARVSGSELRIGAGRKSRNARSARPTRRLATSASRATAVRRCRAARSLQREV